MVDVVSKKKRSEMMAGIGPEDTQPELVVRRLLHRHGYRYTLHDKKLPGKPDLVFKRFRAVIQIQGCFWHGHKCHLFKWPSARKEFWKEKLSANMKRDAKNLHKIAEAGWKTLVIWECALKGKEKLPERELFKTIEAWLLYDPMNAEIVGRGKPSP